MQITKFKIVVNIQKIKQKNIDLKKNQIYTF